jgi:Pin2-interacting protein X1
MSSQGWKPGSLLGARDAAHADLLTAASASHIKVTLKDDTLGLGARIGRDPMEPTGLDAFKGLLGRLNGKSDVELKKEERKRDDVRLARYAALKFPEVRFVSGGLLAQEQKPEISPPIPKEEALTKSNTEKDSIDRSDSSSSESDTPVRKSKRSKSKSKSEKDRSGSQETELKKEKRDKKRKAEDEPTEIASQTAPEVKATPTVSGERRPIGRNVFRSRYIAQKKKALMDDKSLNEVRLTLPGFYERC